MRCTKIYTGMLVAAAFCTCGNVGAQTTVTLADAAADYVDSLSAIDAEPTAFPSGWTYLVSDTASGGNEFELTVLGVGNGGNVGFGTEGNGFSVPAVVGNQNTGDEFEVFGDGFSGNPPNIIAGNQGVVGTDLLMVPGFTNEADPQLEPGEFGNSYVIARYTISAADVAGAVAGTGSIGGSFRDLVSAATSNNNNGGSVDVFVFQNSTAVFSLDRDNTANDPAGNNGMLTQADGTFSLSGLTFAEGDEISFVIGNNENIGGDESALQAAISVDSNGSSVPGDFTGDGFVDDADIDALSANLGLAAGAASDPTMDVVVDGTINLADHDAHITTLVMDANGTGALIGDLNFDGDVDVSQISVGPGGVVNVGDASVLLAGLGTASGAGYADGDLNGDGDIDVSQISIGPGGVTNVGDASILLANLGQSTEGAPAASAVPEPGSLTILALAGIAVSVRRRR